MLTPIVREDFLYYVWKTKCFDMKDLKTSDGQSLEVLSFGNQNYDSGPDFSDAKIKIGQTIWAGNVEMHVYSSDWERHCHDLDKAYDNVILHVVYEHDREVHTTTEQLIPCLEMKNRISPTLHSSYAKLISNDHWIPCEKMIINVPEPSVSFWLQRLIAERIESKTAYLKSLWENTNNNWEETLYLFLMRYMGARVNMDPFESLAKNLPLSLLHRNKDNLQTMESLLFGQAGMLLADHKDAYFQELKKEYNFLSQKYNLKHIPPVSWKFARMRPAGFPTIRIAQIAQILFNNDRLFSRILEEDDIDDIRSFFYAKPSKYWEDHYRFGSESVVRSKILGPGFIDLIIINVVSPILFLYGKSIDDETYCDRAVQHLEAIKPEKNKIIRGFEELDISVKSAADSQALIQMKKMYCDKKRCMSCNIGNKIMA